MYQRDEDDQTYITIPRVSTLTSIMTRTGKEPTEGDRGEVVRSDVFQRVIRVVLGIEERVGDVRELWESRESGGGEEAERAES